MLVRLHFLLHKEDMLFIKVSNKVQKCSLNVSAKCSLTNYLICFLPVQYNICLESIMYVYMFYGCLNLTTLGTLVSKSCVFFTCHPLCMVHQCSTSFIGKKKRRLPVNNMQVAITFWKHNLENTLVMHVEMQT